MRDGKGNARGRRGRDARKGTQWGIAGVPQPPRAPSHPPEHPPERPLDPASGEWRDGAWGAEQGPAVSYALVPPPPPPSAPGPGPARPSARERLSYAEELASLQEPVQAQEPAPVQAQEPAPVQAQEPAPPARATQPDAPKGEAAPAGRDLATTWVGAPEDRAARPSARRSRERGRAGREGSSRPQPREDALRSIRGRRTARLVADRRRRRTRRRGTVVGGAITLVALAVAVAGLSGVPIQPGSEGEADGGAVAGADGYTLLLARHDGDGGPARSVTLLAGGAEDGPALALFLPVGTLVDIPGIGRDRLGLALQYGQAPLLQATVENLLGVGVDHTATVTDQALGALLDRLEGMTVQVPSQLYLRQEDGSAQVRFEAGEQFLDGARLTEYWGFRGPDEDELAALPRQQLVLEALLTELEDTEAREALVGDGAPQLDTAADPEWLRELLARLADAHGDDRIRFALLPVEPFGGPGPDGEATFRVRERTLAQLTDQVMAATLPGNNGGDPWRIQVLNGVGTPGIGQKVDRRLDRGVFRIVLTDNARSFDFQRTQILVYEEGPDALAAADRVRAALGVGSIQVSRQPQSVVDLTIVVGADFLEAVASASDGATAAP